MREWREESDGIGSIHVPADALYGVHTQRALENFALSGRPVHPQLIRAYGEVKLACAVTNHELGWWDAETFSAIEAACGEMIEGRLDGVIAIDALQGGAGTSTNMAVNEVLANRALQLLGRSPGEYERIDPIADLNRHQSTNDTYPTALRVAAIGELRQLERELIVLIDAFQAKERAFEDIVKVGRTQLQDAVLTTLGRSMSAFAEVFARDRWRIHKCEERLRVVNLGGTAIGTGLGAPRQFIFRAIEHLRAITGLGLARAENMVDATQNTDALVEVSGIVRALASNLLKVSNDLRLLASGPDAGLGELVLPARQAGSSIMPGKVNPVIPEAVGQCAIQALACDAALVQACAGGNLELNQYMPLIADNLLTALELMRNACRVFAAHCVTELAANEAACRRQVETATATVTALAGRVGYEQAAEIARRAVKTGRSVRETVIADGVLSAEAFDALISADVVLRLGSPDPAASEEGGPR